MGPYFLPMIIFRHIGPREAFDDLKIPISHIAAELLDNELQNFVPHVIAPSRSETML